MKFRKKPVVIEAMKFDGNFHQISEWVDGGKPPMANTIIRHTNSPEMLTVETLEGPLYAQKGDWIIRGIKGEYYPCKPDIFEATYENADDRPSAG